MRYANHNDTKTLVIPDTHLVPGQSLVRFDALSRFCYRHRPKRVVILGDWMDMASLSHFDLPGSLAKENKRVERDLRVGEEALERLLARQTYKFNVVFIEGNHEERITRLGETHAELSETICLETRFRKTVEDRGFEYTHILYRNYFIDPDDRSLAFTHVPHNNTKPIESVYGAFKVLQSCGTSTIYGHTHKLDFASLRRNNIVNSIYGLNAGCFIEPRYDPPYMKGRIKDWWRGVVMVHHPARGPWHGEFTPISLSTLMETYGSSSGHN